MVFSDIGHGRGIEAPARTDEKISSHHPGEIREGDPIFNEIRSAKHTLLFLERLEAFDL
jgi:hypothetical protein